MKSNEPMSRKYIAGSVVVITGLIVMFVGVIGVVQTGTVTTPLVIGVAITVPGVLLANATHPDRKVRTRPKER